MTCMLLICKQHLFPRGVCVLFHFLYIIWKLINYYLNSVTLDGYNVSESMISVQLLQFHLVQRELASRQRTQPKNYTDPT